MTRPSERFTLPAGADLNKVIAPGVYFQPSRPAPIILPQITALHTYEPRLAQVQAKADWQAVFERAAEELGRSLSNFGQGIVQALEALRDAGLVAEEQPTDPRERALWAKRNRGTGPATPAAWHKR